MCKRALHDNTPRGAYQLVFMMQQAGSTSSNKQIQDYYNQSIIHMVMLKSKSGSDRFMYVSDIHFNDVIQKEYEWN